MRCVQEITNKAELEKKIEISYLSPSVCCAFNLDSNFSTFFLVTFLKALTLRALEKDIEL
jgi:hypothetical protein